MALPPDFPTDPFAILDPAVRWYPGDEMLGELGYQQLLPPLVHKVRQGVKAWRDSGYAGASATTKALLTHWFETEHFLPRADGSMHPFAWYFAQREALESAIWLYEIERARDPHSLIRYDSSRSVTLGMFAEDWTRYVLKLATGAGKTKVMSLLMTWSYFHKLYEDGSDLSTNFLLVAPNIIVLDRLRADFDGARVFFDDPLLPDNGFRDHDWRDDFQMTVHLQDQVGLVAERGNLFLTNIHRLYEGKAAASVQDVNTTDYFLGPKPVSSVNAGVELTDIVVNIDDLVVLNDEAHHIHDPAMGWFRAIERVNLALRQKNSALSAQFDLSATPKHNNGAIFAQTVSDYPLVEAIRQGVVKTPVLPDQASRAKLKERVSDKVEEQWADYLHLGYLEWRKQFEQLEARKKAVLFVMLTETKDCDRVGAYLESRYEDLKDRVLVIHTKANGEISESESSANKAELEKLRKASTEIDSDLSPYRCVVSVMMLREGWDVQNVTAIVGLRPYTSKAAILPEQTLGRGLRRMFRGEDVRETVSVVGTPAFIEFVESIKAQGVELEQVPMGPGTKAKAPIVIEVDHSKDTDRLDIDLPRLTPRLHRDYKNLALLDPSKFEYKRQPYHQFSEEEQREIVFLDIDSDNESHRTVMDLAAGADYRAVVGYFVQSIMRDLRAVGGGDILFGLVKGFIEDGLFEQPVTLDDANTLRNLSEVPVKNTLIETFKAAINALTVEDKGTTEIRDRIKLSRTRPYVTKEQPFIQPAKSLFNKVVGDSHFELEFAAFLDRCDDIVAFAKNDNRPDTLRIEYQNTEGGISHYVPDFLVKVSDTETWIVETKGREDLNDPRKWERLKQWCQDATAADAGRSYKALLVDEADWKKDPMTSFREAQSTYRVD
jgi:type III restriction enzyme